MKIPASKKNRWIWFGAAGGLLLSVLLFVLPSLLRENYESDVLSAQVDAEGNTLTEKFIPTHLKIPEPLKAVYLTSWVAGVPSLRERVVQLIKDTEINAVVIDIKDDTGRISFEVNDEELKKAGAEDLRIVDLREFIARLHSDGVYVIGRVSSFQDPYMVKLHPEWAVKRKSDGGIWKDRKGISWIDAGAKPMWDYLALIGREAYNAGFDEINYDYIRFPSDGNMDDIAYTWGAGLAKPVVMKEYFAYITAKLKDPLFIGSDEVPVVSADLFGMTTTAKNGFDLGIGQVFEDAIYYFDYVAPMVYPSHYPPHFNGYANPNTVPYEIIKIAMDGAVSKISALASTSPRYDYKKTRPWLQDFDYGGNYDVAEVRAQINATYDAGLTSWMVWDPSNRYTKDAYLAGKDGLLR